MRNKFDIDEIEYVNVSYDIGSIYQLFAKEQQHQKERELIKWYCGQKSWTEDQYRKNESTWEEFEDFPVRSSMCSKEPLKLADVDYDLENVKAEIKAQEATVAVDDGDSEVETISKEDRKAKYTGKIFVVLKT